MNVKKLIAELQKMPPNAKVMHIWDGEPRTEIEFVWIARNGFVITADYAEVVYSNDGRPENAPTEKEVSYWYSPSNPNPNDEDKT